MDQQAFRELLSTPRVGSGATPSSSRGFFGATPRRTAVPAQPSNDTGGYKKPADDQQQLKPRKFNKPKAKAPDGTEYRDRAAERRKGKATEYAEVEKLLEDFKERTKDVEDKALIEEQMKILGGDEKHTVLVKGLDFSLLAQQKAKGQKSAAEVEEDLEAAFTQSHASSPSSAPADAGTAGRKSREDIIAALKRRRGGGGAGGSTQGSVPAMDDEFERAKAAGKFRPIGAPKETEAAKEKSAKKRVVVGPDGEVKKLRKKRKVIPAPESDQVADLAKRKETEMAPSPLPKVASSSRQDGRADMAEAGTSTIPSVAPTSPGLPPAPSAQPISSSQSPNVAEDTPLSTTPPAPVPGSQASADDAEGEDIFAGAGDWSGLEDSGSDEERRVPTKDGDKGKARVREDRPTGAGTKGDGKRDWFATGRRAGSEDMRVEGEEEEVGEAQLPGRLTSVVRGAGKDAAGPSASPAEGQSASREGGHGPSLKSSASPRADEEEEGGDEEHAPKASLRGLLSSSLSASDLLAVDEARTAEERRKERKEFFKTGKKAKGKMNEKDKLNKDFQELNQYMEKKKKREGLSGDGGSGSAAGERD